MSRNNEVFEKMPIPKAVATLALPTVLSMIVTVIYNMVDTLFIGMTGDANQVAAVSIGTPVFLILMAFGNMFGIGGSSMISRWLGEGKKEKLKNISSFCFYGGIIFGILLIAVLMIFMPQILTMIGASPNTSGFARSYLQWIALGAPAILIANAFTNIIRGEGGAKIAMVGMMLGTVVNIVLDPLMILWLNMGVAGAAIATVIGNICTVVYYILYLCRGKSALSISIKDFQANKTVVLGVLSVGVPASVNTLLMSAANIVLNNFLASYGDVPVAAMGVAMKANMLVVMIQLGIAMGVQPLIGYNYGSGNIKRMKSVIRFSMMCTIIIGTALTGIYVLSAENVVTIFINDAEVIAYGANMLKAMMISGPVMGILFVIMNTFQAMGKAIPSLILALSRQGIVFLPVLILLNMVVGLDGIIYSQPVADYASVVIAVVMYFIIERKLSEKKLKTKVEYISNLT